MLAYQCQRGSVQTSLALLFEQNNKRFQEILELGHICTTEAHLNYTMFLYLGFNVNAEVNATIEGKK